MDALDWGLVCCLLLVVFTLGVGTGFFLGRESEILDRVTEEARKPWVYVIRNDQGEYWNDGGDGFGPLGRATMYPEENISNSMLEPGEEWVKLVMS